MRIKKKRCVHCHQWFDPDPRSLRGGYPCQRYCSKPECRKVRKKNAQAKWLTKNPDYFKGEVHRKDCLRWRREHPHYWKEYRRKHPEYVQANRQKQRLRDKRQSFLAKKDEIAQNPLRHLDSIRFLAQKNLAKKDEFRVPLEGILDFLVVKEFLAKKDSIDREVPMVS